MRCPDINELYKTDIQRKLNSYIRDNYFEFYQYILNHYPEDLSISQRLYWYYHDINNHPTCPICGKDLKFYSFKKGYQTFCSTKCLANSEYRHNKFKQTCLEKYGVENPFQSEFIKDKIKETNLEKYGVDNPNKSQAIRNKSKQTCLKKYGVEYASQTQEFRNKVSQTCLKRYGVENPFQSESIKNKIKETNLEKYGVENPNKFQEIRNKTKQKCLEKYGTEYYTQSQEYQSRLGKIQKKFKQTNLERYGSEYYSQSQEYQSRYDEIQTKMNNTKRLNHTFNSSQIETDFAAYLDSQNIEYIKQYRSKEYPFNCDFYLPKYDLYIEIQASWVHGHHPYKSDNDIDKAVLEAWETKNLPFYKNAIETWTVRDVKKRETAKQNHLNYLEIFSNDVDEVIKCFKNSLKT
jgi:G:T-mismatch repair DNA endonuclease (very short patch repair protein)